MQRIKSFQFLVLSPNQFELTHHFILAFFYLRVATIELVRSRLQLFVLFHYFTIKHSSVYLKVSVFLIFLIEILLQFQHLPLHQFLVVPHGISQLTFQLIQLLHQRFLSVGHQILGLFKHSILAQIVDLYLQGFLRVERCTQLVNENLLLFMKISDLSISNSDLLLLKSQLFAYALDVRLEFSYCQLVFFLYFLFLFVELLLLLLHFASDVRILLLESLNLSSFVFQFIFECVGLYFFDGRYIRLRLSWGFVIIFLLRFGCLRTLRRWQRDRVYIFKRIDSQVQQKILGFDKAISQIFTVFAIVGKRFSVLIGIYSVLAIQIGETGIIWILY